MSKQAPTTAIGVVIDRSGSMESIRDDTIGGFNAWLGEQQKSDAGAAHVYVTLFGGTDVENRAAGVPLAAVQPLTRETYIPNGSTPLYDAMGRTMAEMEATTADRFLIVVLTDGHENSSIEWKYDALTKRIADLQATDKWTVVYLGSTPDSVAIGLSLGLRAGNVAAFAAGTDAQTWDEVAYNTTHFLRSTSRSVADFAEATKQRSSKTADTDEMPAS